MVSASEFFPIPPHNYDKCLHIFGRSFSRQVYKYLAGDSTLLLSKYQKWQRELGHEICESVYTFGEKHMEIYKVTNITKFRSFQYRLLQRGLVTNVQLHKWNIRINDLCYYCNQETETLVHLMCKCDVINILWRDFSRYAYDRFEIEINIEPRNIILNKVVQTGYQVLNFMCLIIKQFIYRQRCLGKELNFDQALRQIKYVESIERYIATKNGKEIVHNRKWGNTVNHIDGDLNAFVREYIEELS